MHARMFCSALTDFSTFGKIHMKIICRNFIVIKFSRLESLFVWGRIFYFHSSRFLCLSCCWSIDKAIWQIAGGGAVIDWHPMQRGGGGRGGELALLLVTSCKRNQT